jgi:RND family efflux transporter MFP subunit
MGYVREVRVNAGDRVSAGQLLVQLEAKELETAHRQAEAALAEARGGLPEMAAGIRSAEAQVDLARVTFGRMKDLLDKRSVSQQEFDEAAARLRVAEAARESLRAKQHQVEEKIRQAEQQVQTAAVMLGYSSLTAPFAGRILARKVDPGTLAAPGQPLLEIEQEGSWRLEVNVEESRLERIRAGQPVEIRLEASGETFQARVSEIVPAVDAVSRSFVVKIDLPTRPLLRSGMFGRAAFRAGEHEVIAVPVAAVGRQGEVETVLVEESGVARTRLVRLGAERNGAVEVLAGLAAGDRVIHPVPPSLRDGAPVRGRSR